MNTENPYNIDMKSTEPQAMSEKRAGTAILAETWKDYFGALNFFAGSDQENLTYEDVVAHIGSILRNTVMTPNGTYGFIRGMPPKAMQAF